MDLCSTVVGTIMDRLTSKQQELTLLAKDWHNFEKWFTWEAYFALYSKLNEKWNLNAEPCYWWWCDENKIKAEGMSGTRADLVVSSKPDNPQKATIVIEAKIVQSLDSSRLKDDRKKMETVAKIALRDEEQFPAPHSYLQIALILDKHDQWKGQVPDLPWKVVSGSPIKASDSWWLVGYYMDRGL